MQDDYFFIETVIADVFQPEQGWVRIKGKPSSIVEPRQAAHWIMYYYTNHSTANIGMYFGEKDHATIINSVKVVNNRIQTDYEFSCKLRTIIDYIESKGLKVLHKYGRCIKDSRDRKLAIATNYAKPPLPRRFKASKQPTLVSKLIRERNKFLLERPTLQYKRQIIEKTTDINKVIELAKEISFLEKLAKDAEQHVI